MKIVRTMQFDQYEDHPTFKRLEPLRNYLGFDDEEKPRVGRMLRRLLAPGERFDVFELIEAQRVLTELREALMPETTVEWWREQRAPGGDDAVEGLAAGRRNDVTAIIEAEALLREAERRVA